MSLITPRVGSTITLFYAGKLGRPVKAKVVFVNKLKIKVKCKAWASDENSNDIVLVLKRRGSCGGRLFMDNINPYVFFCKMPKYFTCNLNEDDVFKSLESLIYNK